MLSPGDMFRDALCGHGDWKALLSIPAPLDVVPPQPKPHPIPSLPCPVLPSPRVWLLVGIPKELPVEKRRLEERGERLFPCQDGLTHTYSLNPKADTLWGKQ